MTHSCSRLKHLCSIFLRRTWWLLCKEEKASYFTVYLKGKGARLQSPASSGLLQITQPSELSIVGIENRGLPRHCSGLLTTLALLLRIRQLKDELRSWHLSFKVKARSLVFACSFGSESFLWKQISYWRWCKSWWSNLSSWLAWSLFHAFLRSCLWYMADKTAP